MKHPLKSTLARRLFRFFLALSLAPTLLFIIVPSVLRVQGEQETLRQLENGLSEKTDSIFTQLSIRKTQHFEQVLYAREKMLWLLSDTLIQHMTDATVIDPDAPAFDAIHQMAEQMAESDSVIRRLYIWGSGLQWIMPESRVETVLSPVQLGAMLSRFTTAPSETIISETTYMDGVPIMTVAIPMVRDARVIGLVVMDLDLAKLVEEVPSYGLVPQSMLILVSDNGQLLAAPSWSKKTYLPGDRFLSLETDDNLDLLINESQLYAVLDLDWRSAFNETRPIVFEADVDEGLHYFAFSAVPEHSLGIVLVLPESGLYNYAISYGAPLKVALLPIIIQALISGLGFLLVMTIGSVIALRVLAEPLHQLTLGSNVVAEGDFSYRIPNLGTGEIAEVADSFNMMLSAVESTQATLKQNQVELSRALSERQKEFEIINQVTYLTNLATDLPQKLTSVVQIMQSNLDVFASSIYLTNQNNEITSVCRSEAPVADFWRTVIDREKHLANRILTLSSHPSSVHEHEHVCEMQKLLGADGCVEMIAIPICFRNRSAGVLVVHYAEDAAQSDTMLAFLPALATHIAILIENSRLQSQSRFLIIAEERRNLARELHDSVTQAVFSLSLVADGLKTELEGVSEGVGDAIDFLIEQSVRVRKEMRQLINELRPFSLEGESLKDAFHNHISSLQRSADVQVEHQIIGDTSKLQMPIQYNLDRIIQESLSNVARHAHATKVCINLHVSAGELTLTIRDNGVGFDLEHVRERHPEPFGLISMRERAEIMGGQFSIESSLRTGTLISVRVPLGDTL